ncbi:RDD family protein [Fulvivirga maritima]|uniref:RDD family protein n=1 Tax=Fulvivirga maritima TaxID=2904247 RepID=UPI001F195C0D|nr:RDD family protein [Fulvivirga maritima]UII26246.1 RDD family protein [Fulvivirga maritima]
MEEILDFVNETRGEDYVKINIASAGKRLANVLIDFVACYILAFLFGVLIGIFGSISLSEFNFNLLAYLLCFCYYVAMEASCGKTVGKYLTKTKVVAIDGTRPTLLQIMGRSISRFIPFEVFSFFGGHKTIGWHDSLPKTRVIDDK